MKAASAGALLCLLLLPCTAKAAEDGQGYLDLRVAAFPGASGERLQFIEELRPSFSIGWGERLKLVATIDVSFSEGRNAGRISDSSDYLDVDRLYLDSYSSRLDVRAGRQALHWGSAQFFNPTDPFPEVLITEPWRPRRGVNAVRAHVALGALSDVTAVAALDDSLTKARAALRLRTNLRGADAAVSAAWRGADEWLAGVDLRGTLGVGFWLEAALKPTAGDVHEELVAGIDYSFEVFERLVVTAQYYRNGAGATSPDRYDRTARLPAAGPVFDAGSPLTDAQEDPFAPFTLARDYLLVSLAATVTPEVTLSLPALQNLDDGTAVVIPTASWAAAGRLEITLSAHVPFKTWGGGGEFKPRPGDLVVRRDLGPLGSSSVDLSGLVPDATVTLWTRVSF